MKQPLLVRILYWNRLADTGDKSYLLQETYIVGDASTTTTDLDKSAQNELFDQLDDTVIDFSETNPFGDVGGT